MIVAATCRRFCISQNSVFRSDRRRDALEVERELDADILAALIAFELLLDIIAGRRRDGARRGRRRCAAVDEVESGGERLPLRVWQSVGEALRIRHPPFEHLGDEPFVVDLIAEAIGVKGVGQQAIVADEVLDGANRTDIGLVIGGRRLHRRLGRGHRLIPGQVLRHREKGGCGARHERFA